MTHTVDVGTRRWPAFTLVELLVVIGIIALLISILIPALGKAREQANAAKCTSNLRQMSMAAMLFAQEHRGYIPTASDHAWATYADPSRTKFVYRSNASMNVFDWASSLVPYLGSRKSDLNSFMFNTEGQSKVFVCPSDVWQDHTPSAGYALINNVDISVYSTATNPLGYLPISYGINADIACVGGADGNGHFDPSPRTSIFVAGGGPRGVPLDCKLSKVHKPSEVLLFADCGVRPRVGNFPIEYSDALQYSTNYTANSPYIARGKSLSTLEAISKTGWLGNRMPIKYTGLPGQVKGQSDRHKGSRIDVVFCDGHAEGVFPQNWSSVRISPYPPVLKP
jgi:prepilin-type processing-associated H-X9-DG protein